MNFWRLFPTQYMLKYSENAQYTNSPNKHHKIGHISENDGELEQGAQFARERELR